MIHTLVGILLVWLYLDLTVSSCHRLRNCHRPTPNCHRHQTVANFTLINTKYLRMSPNLSLKLMSSNCHQGELLPEQDGSEWHSNWPQQTLLYASLCHVTHVIRIRNSLGSDFTIPGIGAPRTVPLFTTGTMAAVQSERQSLQLVQPFTGVITYFSYDFVWKLSSLGELD